MQQISLSRSLNLHYETIFSIVNLFFLERMNFSVRLMNSALQLVVGIRFFFFFFFFLKFPTWLKLKGEENLF